MNALILLSIIILVTLQSITKKSFFAKVPNGTFSFSAGTAFMALLVFIATSGGKFEYSNEANIYAIMFAVAYSVTTIAMYLALITGPLSITSLISSYSLVIPAAYGLIFLGEKITPALTVGIILLVISLFLINMEKSGEEKKLTLKWAIYVAVGFIGNGACSTIQKVQQLNCNGMYKNEFMIIALIISTVALGICAFIFEKKSALPNFGKGFGLYSVCGIANGAVNYLVLVLSLRMPASVMFPLISAGGIVASLIVAVLFYKEKLSSKQLTGVLLGIGSIIAFNL